MAVILERQEGCTLEHLETDLVWHLASLACIISYWKNPLGSPMKTMKELFIQIDDELYHRASRRVADLENDLNHRVTEYLKSIDGDEDIKAARSRMAELFSQTTNFTVGVKPTREQMHER